MYVRAYFSDADFCIILHICVWFYHSYMMSFHSNAYTITIIGHHITLLYVGTAINVLIGTLVSQGIFESTMESPSKGHVGVIIN